MNKSVTHARAILDAWREQNADRLDPLRFHFIAALERRAATHVGKARRLVDDRLSALLEAYATDLELAVSSVVAADNAIAPGAPARSALGELLDHLANHAATRGGEPAANDTALQSTTLPPLEALGEFQKIWSEVRTESQVRESLEQVPADAGPLNSGSLVHRSLTLMRELSPGYLQQFLSYVDALSWMEQMSHGTVTPTNDGHGATSARKRARAKPRARGG